MFDLQMMLALLDTLEMARDVIPERMCEHVRGTRREFENTKAMLNLHIGQLQRDLRRQGVSR